MENCNLNSVIAMDIVTVGEVSYTPGVQLGCGAFGTVFEGIGSDGTPVAVKHQYIREYNTREQIMKEFSIHKELSAIDNQERVVKLFGMQESQIAITMVLELVPGSLHAILKDVTAVQVQRIFRQLMNGVEFLHSNLVAHCDLSLKNLLISNGDLKIADFGRAKKLAEENEEFLSTECRGTPKFCAPEICTRDPVPVKPFPLDVWSCGVILMQLIQNSEDSWREAKYINCEECVSTVLRPSKLSDNDFETKKKATGSDFWFNIPTTIMNLLRKILEADVSKRATIAEIKNSPYFKKDEREPIKRSGAATRSSGKRARYQ